MAEIIAFYVQLDFKFLWEKIAEWINLTQIGVELEHFC